MVEEVIVLFTVASVEDSAGSENLRLRTQYEKRRFPAKDLQDTIFLMAVEQDRRRRRVFEVMILQ